MYNSASYVQKEENNKALNAIVCAEGVVFVTDRAHFVLAANSRAQKNLFTLAGNACAEREPTGLCQVEADGCDRAKNHLYSGIHGDTVSTHLYLTFAQAS